MRRITLNPLLTHPILTSLPALNELSLRYPDAISLGSGRPADRFCDPSKLLQLSTHFEKYVEMHKKKFPYQRLIGQYGPAQGIINDIIAKHLEVDESIHVKPEDIVVTVGFQEAAEICLKTFFSKDDVLIVPDPIFVGMTGAAILNHVNVQSLRWRGDTFNKEELEKVVLRIKMQGRTPKALYVIPDFSNPYGGCLSLEDRKKLLEWAYAQNILIFEDNPYSMFRYFGEKIPTLKSLDEHKNVIYLGSAAKTIYPGLRIGYVVADGIGTFSDGKERKVSEELSKVKSFNTVNTPPLQQALFAGVLLSHDYSLLKFNQPQIEFNRTNLASLQSTLSKCFPKETYPDISWNKPQGGYFLVMKLPFLFGVKEMEECARDYGVIVIPLSMFSLSKEPSNEVRISFTNMNTETLEKGIRQFADYVDFKLEALKGYALRSRL